MRKIKMLPITIMKEQIIEIKCDRCGNLIAPGQSFWELHIQHNDWGNDSCDSAEEFDLCSHDCVRASLNSYFGRCERSNTQSFWLDQGIEYYILNGGNENGEA